MSPSQNNVAANEPSLDEIFSDPMIQLMMRRDGAKRDSIERALLKLASMTRETSTLQ